MHIIFSAHMGWGNKWVKSVLSQEVDCPQTLSLHVSRPEATRASGTPVESREVMHANEQTRFLLQH